MIHQRPHSNKIHFDFKQQYNWVAGIGCSACYYLQLLILCNIGKTVDDAVIKYIHYSLNNIH